MFAPSTGDWLVFLGGIFGAGVAVGAFLVWVF
jgi:hypothetical protein